jgi:hypothetical protein
MSFINEDLREPILTIFAEAQQPFQSQLIDEVIRLIGCQGLKDSAAKLKWSKMNPEKQLAYSRKWAQRNKEKINARRAEINAKRRSNNAMNTEEKKKKLAEYARKWRAARKATREQQTV